MITILCALLVVSVHGSTTTGSDGTQTEWISALVRQQIPGGPDDTGGNLIQVQPAASSSQVRNISAIGTTTSDSKTKFHLEKNNTKNAEAIRYTEGTTDYYLCVENAGKLQLRKSNVFPSQDKYFFERGIALRGQNIYRYFKSKETGEYIHADSTGRVFMAAVPSSSMANGKPQDRRTWFQFF